MTSSWRNMSSSGKIIPLESLRGIAAVLVVIYHFNPAQQLLRDPVILHGYLMVDLFFVLSGFVIAMNYANRIVDRATFADFMTRRFWRLYPLHLLMLIVFLLIEIAQWCLETMRGSAGALPAFSQNDLPALIANLTLTHALVLDRLSFNHPSWSISTEFFAYLLFGFSMLCGRWRTLVLALMFAGSVLFIIEIDTGRLAEAVYPGGIFRCLFGFVIGCFTWWCFDTWSYRSSSYSAAAAALAVVGAIAWLAASPLEFVIPVSFAACVWTLAGLPKTSAVARLLSTPVLASIGKISYSIYMVHAAIYAVMNFALVIAGHSVAELSAVQGAIFMVIGLASVFATSAITYRYVELPWLSPKRSRSQQALAPTG